MTTRKIIYELGDTMNELYEHRNRLFLALIKIYDNYITPLGCQVKCWKSKFRNDGISFGEDFICGMTVESIQPFDVSEAKIEPYNISYHLPMKYWHLARVIELDKAPPYDGYSSNDVLERLLRL